VDENSEEVKTEEAVIQGEVVTETRDAETEGTNLPVPVQPVDLDATGFAIDQTVDRNGLYRWGKIIAASRKFNNILNASEAVVAILAGREMGLKSITSLTSIYFVSGRPTWTAQALAGFVKRSEKYDYRIRQHTDTVCELAFFEAGEEVGTSIFTMKDAERAGLLKGTNWRSFPRNMLFARALSNGVKWYAPDLLMGGAYVVGELDD
jgi:hypothetical protein